MARREAVPAPTRYPGERRACVYDELAKEGMEIIENRVVGKRGRRW